MEGYTKYEEARIVGARALQLAMGAPFILKLKEEDLVKMNFNPVEIAKREFAQGLIPMAVKRHLPRDMSAVQESKPEGQ